MLIKTNDDPLSWWWLLAFFAGMCALPISLKLGEFILELTRQWRNDRALHQAIQQTQADHEAE